MPDDAFLAAASTPRIVQLDLRATPAGPGPAAAPPFAVNPPVLRVPIPSVGVFPGGSLLHPEVDVELKENIAPDASGNPSNKPPAGKLGGGDPLLLSAGTSRSGTPHFFAPPTLIRRNSPLGHRPQPQLQSSNSLGALDHPSSGKCGASGVVAPGSGILRQSLGSLPSRAGVAVGEHRPTRAGGPLVGAAGPLINPVPAPAVPPLIPVTNAKTRSSSKMNYPLSQPVTAGPTPVGSSRAPAIFGAGTGILVHEPRKTSTTTTFSQPQGAVSSTSSAPPPSGAPPRAGASGSEMTTSSNAAAARTPSFQNHPGTTSGSLSRSGSSSFNEAANERAPVTRSADHHHTSATAFPPTSAPRPPSSAASGTPTAGGGGGTAPCPIPIRGTTNARVLGLAEAGGCSSAGGFALQSPLREQLGYPPEQHAWEAIRERLGADNGIGVVPPVLARSSGAGSTPCAGSRGLAASFSSSRTRTACSGTAAVVGTGVLPAAAVVIYDQNKEKEQQTPEEQQTPAAAAAPLGEIFGQPVQGPGKSDTEHDKEEDYGFLPPSTSTPPWEAAARSTGWVSPSEMERIHERMGVLVEKLAAQQRLCRSLLAEKLCQVAESRTAGGVDGVGGRGGGLGEAGAETKTSPEAADSSSQQHFQLQASPPGPMLVYRPPGENFAAEVENRLHLFPSTAAAGPAPARKHKKLATSGGGGAGVANKFTQLPAGPGAGGGKKNHFLQGSGAGSSGGGILLPRNGVKGTSMIAGSGPGASTSSSAKKTSKIPSVAGSKHASRSPSRCGLRKSPQTAPSTAAGKSTTYSNVSSPGDEFFDCLTGNEERAALGPPPPHSHSTGSPASATEPSPQLVSKSSRDLMSSKGSTTVPSPSPPPVGAAPVILSKETATAFEHDSSSELSLLNMLASSPILASPNLNVRHSHDGSLLLVGGAGGAGSSGSGGCGGSASAGSGGRALDRHGPSIPQAQPHTKSKTPRGRTTTTTTSTKKSCNTVTSSTGRLLLRPAAPSGSGSSSSGGAAAPPGAGAGGSCRMQPVPPSVSRPTSTNGGSKRGSVVRSYKKHHLHHHSSSTNHVDVGVGSTGGGGGGSSSSSTVFGMIGTSGGGATASGGGPASGTVLLGHDRRIGMSGGADTVPVPLPPNFSSMLQSTEPVDKKHQGSIQNGEQKASIHQVLHHFRRTSCLLSPYQRNRKSSDLVTGAAAAGGQHHRLRDHVPRLRLVDHQQQQQGPRLQMPKVPSGDICGRLAKDHEQGAETQTHGGGASATASASSIKRIKANSHDYTFQPSKRKGSAGFGAGGGGGSRKSSASRWH